jgi:hypothetical protein
MGGQAQSAGNNVVNASGNGVVNDAVNGLAPSTINNAQYFVANGSSQPMANEFPQGRVVVTDGSTQALGSSGIANRLPHGAQLYVSLKPSFRVF